MPNLPYAFSTLGMDQFKELFECYSEFEDDLSNPETHPMAVFWNSYLEMVQTLRDFVKSIFHIIPAFQRGWSFNQMYCRNIQQSFSRSGYLAIY